MNRNQMDLSHLYCIHLTCFDCRDEIILNGVYEPFTDNRGMTSYTNNIARSSLTYSIDIDEWQLIWNNSCFARISCVSHVPIISLGESMWKVYNRTTQKMEDRIITIKLYLSHNIMIQGALGPFADDINGIYEPQDHSKYTKSNNKNVFITYSERKQHWEIIKYQESFKSSLPIAILESQTFQSLEVASQCNSGFWRVLENTLLSTSASTIYKEQTSILSYVPAGRKIRIYGATGRNAVRINGIYHPSNDIIDGCSIYYKEGSPSIQIVYWATRHEWNIKDVLQDCVYGVLPSPIALPLDKINWSNSQLWSVFENNIFQIQTTIRITVPAYCPILISGVKGLNSTHINGIFDCCHELFNNTNMYFKRGNHKICIAYNSTVHQWMILPTSLWATYCGKGHGSREAGLKQRPGSDKATSLQHFPTPVSEASFNSCWAYMSSNHELPLDQQLPSSFHVYNGSDFESYPIMKVTALATKPICIYNSAVSSSVSPLSTSIAGVFDPSLDEVRNGASVYRKRHHYHICIIYDPVAGQWQLHNLMAQSPALAYLPTKQPIPIDLIGPEISCWHFPVQNDSESEDIPEATSSHDYVPCPSILHVVPASHSIQIMNVIGEYADEVNGVYIPTESICGGMSVYQCVDSSSRDLDALEYNRPRFHSIITSRKIDESSSNISYSMKHRRWEVRVSVNHTNNLTSVLAGYLSCPYPVPLEEIINSKYIWYFSFDRFTSNSNTNSMYIEQSHVQLSLPSSVSIHISEASGPLRDIVNGLYVPTTETFHGGVVYLKQLPQSQDNCQKNWDRQRFDDQQLQLENDPQSPHPVYHQRPLVNEEIGEVPQSHGDEDRTHMKVLKSETPKIRGDNDSTMAAGVEGEEKVQICISYWADRRQWQIKAYSDMRTFDRCWAYLSHPTPVPLDKINQRQWVVRDVTSQLAPSNFFHHKAKPVVVISGVHGKFAVRINGTYEALDEVHNGFPVYSKRGDRFVVIVYTGNCTFPNGRYARQYQIKTLSYKNRNSRKWAYLSIDLCCQKRDMSEATNGVPLHLIDEHKWFIWDPIVGFQFQPDVHTVFPGTKDIEIYGLPGPNAELISGVFEPTDDIQNSGMIFVHTLSYSITSYRNCLRHERRHGPHYRLLQNMLSVAA